MSTDVMSAFVRRTLEQELPLLTAASDVLHLTPDLANARIHGLLTSVEHFVPGPGGTFRVSVRPLPFVIDYPDDYCSCSDGSLQLRVARVLVAIAHPNIGPGGTVCLGPTFRPSTRLRPLIEHVHRICSSRIYASDSPWDARTAEFFRRYPERVRALRTAPLWRQAVAQNVRVEKFDAARGDR